MGEERWSWQEGTQPGQAQAPPSLEAKLGTQANQATGVATRTPRRVEPGLWRRGWAWLLVSDRRGSWLRQEGPPDVARIAAAEDQQRSWRDEAGPRCWPSTPSPWGPHWLKSPAPRVPASAPAAPSAQPGPGYPWGHRDPRPTSPPTGEQRCWRTTGVSPPPHTHTCSSVGTSRPLHPLPGAGGPRGLCVPGGFWWHRRVLRGVAQQEKPALGAGCLTPMLAPPAQPWSLGCHPPNPQGYHKDLIS